MPTAKKTHPAKKAAAGIERAKKQPATATADARTVSVPGVRGTLATKHDLSAWYGKAINTISAWQKKGLSPKVDGETGTGKPTLFDSLDVHEWLLAEVVEGVTGAVGGYLNKDQQQARYYKAQADKIEMENAARAAKLLDADHVREARERIYGNIRARLLSIPSKAAPHVAAESNRALCANLIEELVYEALQELSETELTPAPDGKDPTRRRRHTRKPKGGGKRKPRRASPKTAAKTKR